MPDSPDTIFLCESETVPNIEIPLCLPGRVAVAMYRGEKRGLVYAPPSGSLSPDVGVGVSSGVRDLSEGDEVVVVPYKGMWIDDWRETGYQLRLFGVVSKWHKTIPAVRTPLGFEPTHDWVLLTPESLETDLVLPDDARVQPSFARVEAIGPRCMDVSPGNRVAYEHKDVLKLGFGGDGMVFVPFKRLLAVLK